MVGVRRKKRIQLFSIFMGCFHFYDEEQPFPHTFHHKRKGKVAIYGALHRKVHGDDISVPVRLTRPFIKIPFPTDCGEEFEEHFEPKNVKKRCFLADYIQFP